MRILTIGTLLIMCISVQCQTAHKRSKVEIETQFGNIVIELYDETPKHRDNFIKLVSEKYYDDLIFHRVIKNFMIQGGDPNSRNAKPGEQLGSGGPDYTVEAEFVPHLFHKKGALAAARQGDNVNPEKRSSGSQFYIVQGTTVTPQQLKSMEMRINQPQMQQLVGKYIAENPEIEAKLRSFQETQQYDSINEIINPIVEMMEKSPEYKPFKYSDEQIQIYSQIGGTPHLDGAYTVFGEVVEGLNVIDSIAAQQTGQADRPVEDIKMKIRVIK
ncbi:MAG TPA: peptidylprolyl isomerase [Salinivirgaceae bacterium]|nr:peptidylprolyl isomerase [Salinivirgaceae bacterium]